MLAGCPRFREAALACWFHHRVINFLELHPRSAHTDECDKRSEHFVRAFADLVNARVAHHSFHWKIDKICRAAVNLKYIVDALPQPLRCEHLEHRRFEQDRKSTRLNSSHLGISYAVF